MATSLKRAAILLFFCLAALLSAQTSLRGGRIVKVDAGNPSLAITEFQGDAAARAILEGVLVRCDWFQVIRGNRAQLQVSVAYTGAPSPAYTGKVTVAGGDTISLSGRGATPNLAACQFVDLLLRELFRVPALCTRPFAYVRSGNGNRKEIFTCYIDGSGERRLTHNNAISTEPYWGHPGALVYTLNNGFANSVLLVDIANNRQRTVSRARGLNSSPALSPDGRTLVLPLSLEGQVDLYSVDLANGRRTRLTRDRDVESSPCFSPDGKSICYVSDKSGRPQLYLMDLATRQGKRLQLGSAECVSPSWSRVTNRLAYAARTASGQYVIQILDMKKPGAQPVLITTAAGNWESPSWAPDGRHLICTRQSGRNQELFLIDSWYHAFQQITRGTGYSLPAW